MQGQLEPDRRKEGLLGMLHRKASGLFRGPSNLAPQPRLSGGLKLYQPLPPTIPPRPIRSSPDHFCPSPSCYLGELGIKPQSHSRGPHDSGILKENPTECLLMPRATSEMGGFAL